MKVKVALHPKCCGIWKVLVDMDHYVWSNWMCTFNTANVWMAAQCRATYQAWLWTHLPTGIHCSPKRASLHLPWTFDRTDNYMRNTYKVIKPKCLPQVMSVETEIRSTATLRRSQKGCIVFHLEESYVCFSADRDLLFGASVRQLLQLQKGRSFETHEVCNATEWSFTGFWSILIPILQIHSPWTGVRWFMRKHQSDHTESWSDPHIGHEPWWSRPGMTAGLLMIWNFRQSKQWNICVACLNHVGIQEWRQIICRLGQYCWPKLKKSNTGDIVDLWRSWVQYMVSFQKLLQIRFFCGGHTFYQIKFLADSGRGSNSLMIAHQPCLEKNCLRKLKKGRFVLDLVKAFNCIPRRPLMKMMLNLGVPEQIVTFGFCHWRT